MKRLITLILMSVLLISNLSFGVSAKDKHYDPCSAYIPGTDIIRGCYTVVAYPDLRGLPDKEVRKAQIERSEVLRLVNRFYKVVLNREGDWSGLKYWAGIIVSNKNNKGTTYMASDGFFHSTEFLNKKVSDSKFLDICYKAFFDRKADLAGKAYWMKRIKTIGRDGVIKGFVDSTEFYNLINSYLSN